MLDQAVQRVFGHLIFKDWVHPAGQRVIDCATPPIRIKRRHKARGGKFGAKAGDFCGLFSIMCRHLRPLRAAIFMRPANVLVFFTKALNFRASFAKL